MECLQWLVEEGKVPFQVRDTGGETLMHHAAFHGQVSHCHCVTMCSDSQLDSMHDWGAMELCLELLCICVIFMAL